MELYDFNYKQIGISIIGVIAAFLFAIVFLGCFIAYFLFNITHDHEFLDPEVEYQKVYEKTLSCRNTFPQNSQYCMSDYQLEEKRQELINQANESNAIPSIVLNSSKQFLYIAPILALIASVIYSFIYFYLFNNEEIYKYGWYMPSTQIYHGVGSGSGYHGSRYHDLGSGSLYHGNGRHHRYGKSRFHI